jgi:hypothetical protein
MVSNATNGQKLLNREFTSLATGSTVNFCIISLLHTLLPMTNRPYSLALVGRSGKRGGGGKWGGGDTIIHNFTEYFDVCY